MKIQTIILTLFAPIFYAAATPDYGIYIKSYPYTTSELSNLVLENGEPILLNREIELSFDMYVRNDNVFGTILRLITDKNENIDLLFTVGADDKRFPIFVINESVYPIQQEIIREDWITVSMIISPQRNTITFNYGGEIVTAQYPISKSKSFRAAFGSCPFEGFTLTDVASVNLKDIRIFRNNKPFRYWKLEKHREDLCYDSIASIPAVAHKPIWLIDKHITWDRIFTIKVDESPSVTFNPDKDEFYIISDSQEIIVFNTRTHKKSNIFVKGGLYAANAPNQLLYIPERKALLSYNMDEEIYSFFSFGSDTWSNYTASTKEHSYWNNSVVFNPTDLSLVSFGGYGFYRYNNELVKIYPFGNKPTEKILLSDITPRYSAGTVIVDHILYVFGGRGNKTGRQELFPKNFYDFYSVNLRTNQVNKLWEVEHLNGGDFIPSENLIFDPDNNCFYIFTNQSGGNLLKITTDKPGFEPMTLFIQDKIEVQFLYSNLYYSSHQQKLFAIINKTDVNNKAEINIYSLDYPPVSVAEMIQPLPSGKITGYRGIFRIIIVLVLLAALASFYYVRNKKGISSKADSEDIRKGKKESVKNSPEVKVRVEKEDTFIKQSYDFNKHCICFLGGFHVRDKNGDDITSIFTPTLKALLILLILYTEENQRGISGKKMFQLLWGDKSESSARNNRNVYLSKLRTLLERIGTIDIVNKSGFWCIEFGNDVTCDYMEAMHYLKNVKEEQLEDESEYNKLLELLLRGTLLPNTEIDWIDRFKSDFSNLTIDTLSSLLTNREKISNNLKFRIAETLFQHDFINEEALHIKCKILSESGKMGLAKSFYDSYCKEYFNLLGSEYKYSLSDVLKGENID